MKNFIAIGNRKSLGFCCLALVAGLFIFSCSDDENDVPPANTASKTPYMCTTCASVSAANADNDNSSDGIYKGVFLDGAVDINFRNNQRNITGKVYYNNKTIDLSESPEIVLVGGKRVHALLRGDGENSDMSLVFSVNSDGSDPQVTDFNLTEVANVSLSEGSPEVSCMVIKEKSKMLLEAFEGNYFRVSNTNVPPGPMPGGGVGSKRADSEFGIPGNAVAMGSVRVLLSRSDNAWVMFSPRTLNNAGSDLDHGVIVDGFLRSDITGKNIARLAADELNHKELLDSGTLYLDALRKR